MIWAETGWATTGEKKKKEGALGVAHPGLRPGLWRGGWALGRRWPTLGRSRTRSTRGAGERASSSARRRPGVDGAQEEDDEEEQRGWGSGDGSQRGTPVNGRRTSGPVEPSGAGASELLAKGTGQRAKQRGRAVEAEARS